jgi:hypothetical protein
VGGLYCSACTACLYRLDCLVYLYWRYRWHVPTVSSVLPQAVTCTTIMACCFVLWQVPGLCIHAKLCFRPLSDVWCLVCLHLSGGFSSSWC